MHQITCPLHIREECCLIQHQVTNQDELFHLNHMIFHRIAMNIILKIHSTVHYNLVLNQTGVNESLILSMTSAYNNQQVVMEIKEVPDQYMDYQILIADQDSYPENLTNMQALSLCPTTNGIHLYGMAYQITVRKWLKVLTGQCFVTTWKWLRQNLHL